MKNYPSDAMNRLNYTAFVPKDQALKKELKSQNISILNQEAIDAFLLEHLVSGYIFKKEFENGFYLLTLTNKVIPIRVKDSK